MIVILENESLRLEVIPETGAFSRLQARDRDGHWTDLLPEEPDAGYAGPVAGPFTPETGAAGVSRIPFAVDKSGPQMLQLSRTIPGQMECRLTISLDGPALIIREWARAQADAVWDPAVPLPLNLSGFRVPAGLHILSVKASRYAPADAEGLPTGEIRLVKNTPFDFREPRYLQDTLTSRHPQIRTLGGVRHGFYLEDTQDVMQLFSPDSGIELSVDTTLPVLYLAAGPEAQTVTIRTGYGDDDIRIDPVHSRTILPGGSEREETTVFHLRPIPAQS